MHLGRNFMHQAKVPQRGNLKFRLISQNVESLTLDIKPPRHYHIHAVLRIRMCIHDVSRARDGRVARILFACDVYPPQSSRLVEAAAFNEMTLVLLESRDTSVYAFNRPVILNWMHYSGRLLKISL